VYVLLETHAAPPLHLADTDGVAGVWSAVSRTVDASLASAPAGQSLSYCFLDEDPVSVAERLRPTLEARWTEGDGRPLLAAPFHVVVPHEWDRHVP
jgi:hypothetical protein